MRDSKKSLLIVDDEELIRELLSDILADEYNLILCKDGAEGIENFDKYAPQLSGVITDLVMPKVSGDMLIQHIRKRMPSLPILIITGYERETDTTLLQKGKSIHLLQKPFRIDRLQSVLNEMLNES
jgi:DNA-binding NtrC family response regulator